LSAHSWPGNIRELANVIEYAAILSDRLPIKGADLPGHLGSAAATPRIAAAAGQSLREIEMQTIHATLDKCQGNKTAAAQLLGISLKTLYNKLNSEAIRKAA
jgi:two-component system NtrC family response regulator